MTRFDAECCEYLDMDLWQLAELEAAGEPIEIDDDDDDTDDDEDEDVEYHYYDCPHEYEEDMVLD